MHATAKVTSQSKTWFIPFDRGLLAGRLSADSSAMGNQTAVAAYFSREQLQLSVLHSVYHTRPPLYQ